ncbi:hypothetical protein M406DRAFT_100672 [Cryphonectria parasitica EP155]|uniref:Uncharacterized protein n=1 Tax=Cryphonectria parasitica (strain ATCC 38755 / EP155) TaxID=660469 RepID=A0A9P4YBW8_CRYP1|nr:uncharacterized protein M406DRAFT_100672 [Cryphonectria parasitica EP155]KAF3770037.1 hypothetical protein M406DRAFT_100672 [Cryphonectria parasitica EP155]
MYGIFPRPSLCLVYRQLVLCRPGSKPEWPMYKRGDGSRRGGGGGENVDNDVGDVNDHEYLREVRQLWRREKRPSVGEVAASVMNVEVTAVPEEELRTVNQYLSSVVCAGRSSRVIQS